MKKENLDRFEKASLDKKNTKDYLEMSGFMNKKIVANCGVDTPYQVLIKDTNVNGDVVGLYNYDMVSITVSTIEADSKIFNSKAICSNDSDVLFVTGNEIQALNVIENSQATVYVKAENIDAFLEIIKKTEKFISPIVILANIPELEEKLKKIVVFKDRYTKVEEKLNVIGFVEAENIVLANYKENNIVDGNFDKGFFQIALDLLERACRGKAAVGQRTLNKEYLKNIADGSGVPISTGIDVLDGGLGGGLFKGRLTIIGGETGIGKTALIVNIMRNLAKRKIETHYIALEIEGLEMRNRTMALEMAYSYQNIAGATVDNLKSATELNNIEEIQKFDEIDTDVYRDACTEYLDYANMEVVHAGGAVASTAMVLSTADVTENLGITMEAVRDIVIRRVKAGVTNLVLIVDYIQLIKSDKADAIQQMDQITMFLKAIAIEFKISIIGLSSINKVSANKNVSTSVFKGSNSISYTADVAMVLAYNLKTADWESATRDEDAKNAAIIKASKKAVRDVICTICKNRMGTSGHNVPLAFVGKCGLLDNYITVRKMGFTIEDTDFKDAITLMKGIPGNAVTETIPTTPTTPKFKKSVYKAPPLNSNPWGK